MKYLFDLDGTITSQETLPIIARLGGVADRIDGLTKETIQGNVPFIESFIQRVNILKDISVSAISDRLAKVPLYQGVHRYIMEHPDDCIVVTGNLSCWCEGLFKAIGCRCYSSKARVENDTVVKRLSILRKETVVDEFKAQGEKVVFIGDGNNDMEAMRHADISIAAGLTHNPANSLFAITDYMVFNETALCRLLNQLS